MFLLRTKQINPQSTREVSMVSNPFFVSEFMKEIMRCSKLPRVNDIEDIC